MAKKIKLSWHSEWIVLYMREFGASIEEISHNRFVLRWNPMAYGLQGYTEIMDMWPNVVHALLRKGLIELNSDNKLIISETGRTIELVEWSKEKVYAR